MYPLNYYKTARFCVVSYTAGSLLLFGVTQRQERCVASLECGIFTGCPRGSEPPGHKGNNVIDVVVCLLVCFSVDDFVSGKIELSGKQPFFLDHTLLKNWKSMANIVSLPTACSFEKHCKYLLHRRRC